MAAITHQTVKSANLNTKKHKIKYDILNYLEMKIGKKWTTDIFLQYMNNL